MADHGPDQVRTCSPTSSTGGCAGLPVKARLPTSRFASTHLGRQRAVRPRRRWRASILDAAIKAVSPSTGAWPTLMAATADLPGDLRRPQRPVRWGGSPQVTTSSRRSHDGPPSGGGCGSSARRGIRHPGSATRDGLRERSATRTNPEQGTCRRTVRPGGDAP